MPKKQVDAVVLNRRIKMRQGGMTYQEIADIEQVSKQAIAKQIAPLMPDQDALDSYKQHRADILAGKQIELLQALTPDKIKDASALQIVTQFGILTDKERLERGQSTANVDTVLHSISSELTDLIAERNKLLSGGDKQD